MQVARAVGITAAGATIGFVSWVSADVVVTLVLGVLYLLVTGAVLSQRGGYGGSD
jgi:hypothetical protein